MNPVVEILHKNREAAIDDLVASLVATIPKYSLASPGEVRASTAVLYDEFLKVLDTGQTERLTEILRAVSDQRVAQGFTPADFVRALLMAYPVVRSVVRRAGPRNDAVFSKMFDEVENAVFRCISLATNIYAAGVTRHVEARVGELEQKIFTGGENEGAISGARAAVAIQAEIQKLNAVRQADQAEPITVGIGVNTGTVVMGTVGSEERMSFTVIGDAVNVADRLQSLAGAGEIVVGMHTQQQVKEKFELEELGERVLKGRTHPELLFRLKAEKK